MPIATATRTMFRRYGALIEKASETRDPFRDDPRLSLANLAWICRTGADEVDRLPIDKTSRWLGFVQGCLAMRGLISVDEERSISRPLFHAAYGTVGITPPDTLEQKP